MSKNTLLMGAVAYDPKVVTIWEGFRDWFAKRDLDFDFVLYSNYERQVEAHFAGHVDIAWNSPLAWIQADRLAKRAGRKATAVAMRDTDRDLTSVVLTRSDSGIDALEGLRGKRVAVGAGDSPQATLIPLEHFAQHGLQPGKDFEVVKFDVLVGKHGDHIGGERDAVKALLAGKVDASCMIDGNHLAFTKEGTIPGGKTKILAQTKTFDHCNFTIFDDAPTELVARFTKMLMQMSYDDPEVRTLLDLEGLKQWTEGRTEGYALLEAAVDRFGTIESFLSSVGARCT